MNLSTLSDVELSAALEKLTGKEREVTLRILYHLIEIERRGFFRDLGYSSLFDYCTKKLKYSEGSAYKRITASRCLKDKPELGDSFLRGEITLCTITTASRALKEETTSVQELAGKSKREVERMVAKSIEVKPKERIKPVMLAAQELPLFAQIPQQEARYELKFSVTEEVYNKLEAAKLELSSSLGRELTLEALLEKLLDIQQKPKVRTRHSNGSSTRYIPKEVRRAVLARDSRRCSFVAPDGTRCTAKHYLQFDHIVPFSCGGMSTEQNLRLVCPTHNKLLAEWYFGNNKINQFAKRN